MLATTTTTTTTVPLYYYYYYFQWDQKLKFKLKRSFSDVQSGKAAAL